MLVILAIMLVSKEIVYLVVYYLWRGRFKLTLMPQTSLNTASSVCNLSM